MAIEIDVFPKETVNIGGFVQGFAEGDERLVVGFALGLLLVLVAVAVFVSESAFVDGSAGADGVSSRSIDVGVAAMTLPDIWNHAASSVHGSGHRTGPGREWKPIRLQLDARTTIGIPPDAGAGSKCDDGN